MTSRGNLLSNNKQTNQSVFFTLPITCQICLGKVKEPCVCPNLHAFCSFCLEIWLEKSKHCPTCRVPIDKDNPCRRILGGIENVEESDSMKPTEFSHPSTRKARYFSIFQQYEDEITRLSNCVESLNEENKKLKESNKNLNQTTLHSSPQHDMIQLLKHKLQTVQNNYDELLRERDMLKEQNKKFESENSILIQDNARLKTVLNDKNTQTSKYTVSALETKIESYEKEIKQLQKALDKSDKYIADLEFKREMKDKENKLSRHLSEETFTSNSLSIIPSTSSAFSSSKPTNTSSKHIESNIKSTKNEVFTKADLKSVKFSEKVDKYPSSGILSPPRSSDQLLIKRNVIPKDSFYGSPRKAAVHSNVSNSSFTQSCFGDRIKKLNTTNTTVTSNFDFETPTHSSQSLLNMNNNQTNNLFLSNSSNSFNNQVTSQSFLFSPMKRLRLEEINLEKPEPDPIENKKITASDNITTSSEFIDCMEILNRAEKNVQSRQLSPRKTYTSSSSHFTMNEKLYSQLNDVIIQSDSSVNSSSSSGNSLSANGASSLSSFSNTTSSDSSSCNLNSLIKKGSKKKSEKNSNTNSLLINSYSLNSHQNIPQQDMLYKEYGQSLNYGTNSAINLSAVNRSRSVEPSIRNFK